LNNGQASGKLKVNGASHNYRAMFSLNNDHFLSGSFECLASGFEAAFGLQSSALPSEFQVSKLHCFYYLIERNFTIQLQ
jgi:hypothetical protein